jgi:hypothetical protein
MQVTQVTFTSDLRAQLRELFSSLDQTVSLFNIYLTLGCIVLRKVDRRAANGNGCRRAPSGGSHQRSRCKGVTVSGTCSQQTSEDGARPFESAVIHAEASGRHARLSLLLSSSQAQRSLLGAALGADAPPETVSDARSSQHSKLVDLAHRSRGRHKRSVSVDSNLADDVRNRCCRH